MRIYFFAALVGAVIISTTFWYRTTAAVCPVPLSYRVGEIDSSFNLSLDEAKLKVLAAETQWERVVNRDLFVYDEDADFVVNFIYDERQEQSNAEERQRRFLDGQLAENEELFAAVELAQTEYDNIAASYETRADAYEERLSAYNKKVQQYNDRGGAPEDAFEELETERRELNTESEELSELVTQLNELASQINKLSAEGNRLIDAYNDEVETYNEQFGYAREFTQGDYHGDMINIYEFSSDNELQAVLLHEFGHALGIDHVDAPSSVMYYLLEDADSEPLLSDADMQAYYEVCGVRADFGQEMRRLIRDVLNKF